MSLEVNLHGRGHTQKVIFIQQLPDISLLRTVLLN